MHLTTRVPGRGSRGLVGLACVVAAVMVPFGNSAHAETPAHSGKCTDCAVRYVKLWNQADPGSGPGVLEVGSPHARRVVVLVPGWFEGAGSFELLATALVARLPDTQVWVMDRREQSLDDLSHAASPLRVAADYYLRGRYALPQRSMLRAEEGWGLATTLGDLRRIVLAARDHGDREVVLGGHSWGASLALLYAGWDFHGHPGFRGLSGLVLIDGGVHGWSAGEGDVYDVTPQQARSALNALKQQPVDQTLAFAYGVHGSATAPLVFALAGRAALSAPAAPSWLETELPASMRPPVRVTNRALLGWLIDSHAPVPDLRVRTGHLAVTGAVRDWVQTGPTPISRIAEALAGPEPTAWEWYWPARLTLDLEAADPFAETPTARLLGLRLYHTTQIDTPLFSFETGLEHGTVNTSAHWLVAHSKIAYAEYRADPSMTHLDPLLEPPARNEFVKTVIPFLLSLADRRPHRRGTFAARRASHEHDHVL